MIFILIITGPSSPRSPSVDNNDNVDVGLMSANRSVSSLAIFFLAAYTCQVLKGLLHNLLQPRMTVLAIHLHPASLRR